MFRVLSRSAARASFLLLMEIFLLFFLFSANNPIALSEEAARVVVARKAKETDIRKLFKQKKLSYPPHEIFLRVFKKEKTLELWARDKSNEPFALVKTYAVCRTSGTAGPKRKEGDGQMPEGFYKIAHFNPYSRFYLSLKINYPNASDKILGNKGNPGGDIFIHGNCVTIGCVPITDNQIKELYVIALDARASGQKNIPVHIFPSRMNTKGMLWLKTHALLNSAVWQFWLNLKEGYDYFETRRTLPYISVDTTGKYMITSP